MKSAKLLAREAIAGVAGRNPAKLRILTELHRQENLTLFN